MNKTQFKMWLEKDHFACFPGIKGFFNKRTEEERKDIYRKWFAVLKPYDEGWAIKASELLMTDCEGLMPQDHPSRIAAICRRLQPRPRDETLESLDMTAEQREEIKKWPALYPHIAKIMTAISEEIEKTLEERSQIASDDLRAKFDQDAKIRLDDLVEELKIQANEAYDKEMAEKDRPNSTPNATSTPPPTTDTPEEEVALESKPATKMSSAIVDSMRQTLIELDGKQDIPF